ncbi:hypothetical protein EIM50_14915 [Pseudoxanthomonas sp. SGD-10]|nr:hypothetical protein EIM50_14915 [Pseudoxanthomonas sp. SGD-10]
MTAHGQAAPGTRRSIAELLVVSSAALVLALALHSPAARLALATAMDGFDNVFLCVLFAGLGLLDLAGRLPAVFRKDARRIRLVLWLGFAGAVLLFGGYALPGILLAELAFDLVYAVAGMRGGVAPGRRIAPSGPRRDRQ